MKARRPWFKFWASEWLSNRRVSLMTPAQKGVYIDLLALCWQEGAIPADPAELAFLLRLSLAEFEPLWASVKKHFRPSNRRKFLTNNRLELERGDAADKSAQAKKAADTRWLEDADALQTHSDSIDSAIPHKKKKKEEEDLSLALQEALPRFDFEALYSRYPNKNGKAKGLAKLKAIVRTEADFQAVSRGLESFIAEEKRKGTEVKYYPHFSTWVNQRRWEDFAASVELAPAADRPMTAVERHRLREAQERGLL